MKEIKEAYEQRIKELESVLEKHLGHAPSLEGREELVRDLTEELKVLRIAHRALK